MHLVTVVVSIIERPKQHYIGSRMFKFGKWYERSKTIVEDSVDALNKKRKQSDQNDTPSGTSLIVPPEPPVSLAKTSRPFERSGRENSETIVLPSFVV